MSFRTRPGSAATRTARRRAELALRAATLAAALLVPGCLSDQERNTVINHEVQSKAYYDAGDYVRAEDQCRRGLAIDEDDSILQLTLGFALLMQATPPKLAEADAIFGEHRSSFGSGDWRFDLGYGTTQQQLARQWARDAEALRAGKASKAQKRKDLPDAAWAAELEARVPAARANARDALESAAAAAERTKSSLPDIDYQLALLDLEEEKLGDFRRHAATATEKLLVQQKVLDAQLGSSMGQTERERTERERAENAARGRRLSRELARVAFNEKDLDGAAAAMERLEKFGKLDAADYYSRAEIRAKLGSEEPAIADYQKFIDLSPDQLDDRVGHAVHEILVLRARVAERRTAPPAPKAADRKPDEPAQAPAPRGGS